jgi:hypothetical protein
LRLAPFMNNIISPCQSAFIKRRCIHDNFLYVRNLTRRFHKSKTSSLLIKIDISKAFDFVRWDYLLSVLERRGFPARWREMDLFFAHLLHVTCYSQRLTAGFDSTWKRPTTGGPSLPTPFHFGHRPSPSHPTSRNRKGTPQQAKGPHSQISGVDVRR